MQDSQPYQKIVSRGGSPRSNGRGLGPAEPLDRSYLLRRATRFPFPGLLMESDPIRLRRERRVFAPFTRIPPLSRGGPT